MKLIRQEITDIFVAREYENGVGLALYYYDECGPTYGHNCEIEVKEFFLNSGIYTVIVMLPWGEILEFSTEGLSFPDRKYENVAIFMYAMPGQHQNIHTNSMHFSIKMKGAGTPSFDLN
jgi:hypothetical protein